MTVLHSTEPATVYLSLLARVDGLTVADVDAALYDDRSLVKQLAMRRTLFVFPRDLLPAAWGSASARVAAAERARLAKERREGRGLAEDGEAWLDRGPGRGRRGSRRSSADRPGGPPAGPELEARLRRSRSGTKYGRHRLDRTAGAHPARRRGPTSCAAANTGALAAVQAALDADGATGSATYRRALDADDGYAELVRRWLATFGPGTETDIVWWLGSTKTAVRRALADLEAVEVSLDGGGTGWVLPDDLEPRRPTVEPWAALLPVLDPTVMGWKERAFYLGDHAPQLFDTNGNAGTTAWWDGRVVGCWVQDEAGVVEVRLLEKLPRAATAALAVEAERLTAWLDGTRVGTVYPSVAMKAVDWVHP